MDEHGENFNKELENIKKDQLGLKNTINKMKNTLEGINRKLGDTKEFICDLEKRIVENTQSGHKKEF